MANYKGNGLTTEERVRRGKAWAAQYSTEWHREKSLKTPWWEDPEVVAARSAKMKANPNWQASIANSRKGGKTRKDGRVDVYWRGRYRPRARVVMEQHLGRELLRSEHVHHINHDCADDRIENLTILSQGEHSRLHNAARMAEGTWHQPRRPPKMSDSDVVEAQRMLADGVLKKDVAAHFGVSKQTLWRRIGKTRGLS